MKLRASVCPLFLLLVIACEESSSDNPGLLVAPKSATKQVWSLAPLAGEKLDRIDTVLATTELRVVVTRKDLGMPAYRAQGVPVSWRLVNGLPEGSHFSGTTYTDVSGVALATVTFGSMRTGFILEASIPRTDPVRFRVFAGPGTPTRVVIRAGDGLIGLVNAVVGWYDAVIADSYGNEVGGPLEWKVTSGGGSLVEPPCDPEVSFCPRAGWYHVLGPIDGPQTVTATATELPGKPYVTFTATAASALIWAGGKGMCYGGFDPEDVSVARGNTVAWTWCNIDYSARHNVTFEDGKGSSQTMMDGWHVRTFADPGIYRFRCTMHSSSFSVGEVGAITVK
jgi:plastocyanin